LENVANPDYKTIDVKAKDRLSNEWKITEDKMNLFKLLPNEDKFLLVGANKEDGYYVASHFEVIDKTGDKLIEYIKRGTPLDEKTRMFLASHILQEFDTFFTMFL
jgi:hypothetical protein